MIDQINPNGYPEQIIIPLIKNNYLKIISKIIKILIKIRLVLICILFLIRANN